MNDMQLAGIGPAPRAWEARILPLNYSCVSFREENREYIYMVCERKEGKQKTTQPKGKDEKR